MQNIWAIFGVFDAQVLHTDVALFKELSDRRRPFGTMGQLTGWPCRRRFFVFAISFLEESLLMGPKTVGTGSYLWRKVDPLFDTLIRVELDFQLHRVSICFAIR